MIFQTTHTRKDGKVDVNLVVDNGETAIYHRIYKDRKGEEIFGPWGVCSSKRFAEEFVPC